MATVCERITALREKMKENGITVYVVPSTDCHESEYVCPHYRARAYMTGFTGSAGTAVITMDKAGLWQIFSAGGGSVKRTRYPSVPYGGTGGANCGRICKNGALCWWLCWL